MNVDRWSEAENARRWQTGRAETKRFPLTVGEGLNAFPSLPLSDQRHAANAAGSTGDPCPSCQSFTLKRSGSCQVCDTYGAMTGCA